MIYLYAFISGGLLCVICQLLLDRTKLTLPKILVGFVTSGIILGAFGIYDKFIEFASSGACLPLSGFGAVLSEGTREAVDAYGLLGAFYGPLSAGSGGITFVIFCAVIVSFFAKPKPK